MALNNVALGKLVQIQRIDILSETRAFLSTLGFNVGENVTVVAQNRGNVIVSVRNTRIALGKCLASQIII